MQNIIEGLILIIVGSGIIISWFFIINNIAQVVILLVGLFTLWGSFKIIDKIFKNNLKS